MTRTCMSRPGFTCLWTTTGRTLDTVRSVVGAAHISRWRCPHPSLAPPRRVEPGGRPDDLQGDVPGRQPGLGQHLRPTPVLQETRGDAEVPQRGGHPGVTQ